MPENIYTGLPDSEIERFLMEDCPYGDLTTALLDIGPRLGRISFTPPGHETVACCTEEAVRLFEGARCSADLFSRRVQ